MEHHTSKNRSENKDALAAANTATKRKSFSTFLIESDFKPLVFAGRCMQYFGVGTVIGVFVGAVFVYGYANFRPLPLIVLPKPPIETPTPAPTQPPVQPKTVWLHGVVTNNDKPVKEQFEIGVLANAYRGPFQAPDGSFSIQVPEAEKGQYLITLWNAGYQKFKLVQKTADSDGNVHDVVFDSSMAKLERNNQGSEPSNSFASVGQRLLRERRIRLGSFGRTRSGFAGLARLNKRSQR